MKSCIKFNGLCTKDIRQKVVPKVYKLKSEEMRESFQKEVTNNMLDMEINNNNNIDFVWNKFKTALIAAGSKARGNLKI